MVYLSIATLSFAVIAATQSGKDSRNIKHDCRVYMVLVLLLTIHNGLAGGPGASQWTRLCSTQYVQLDSGSINLKYCICSGMQVGLTWVEEYLYTIYIHTCYSKIPLTRNTRQNPIAKITTQFMTSQSNTR